MASRIDLLKRASDVHIIKMHYVWNPQKRLTNIKKHGIDFVDAIGVLEDENALKKSIIEGGEYRFLTLGVGVKPRKKMKTPLRL